MVVCHIFYLDRAEGSKSDMQSHMCNVNAFLSDLFQQFRCKMQPGCRCCGRSIVLCVHCLITVFVLELVMDVRRQRHLSQFVKDLFKNTLVFKTDQTVSFVNHIDHLTDQQPFAKTDPCTDTAFLTWFYQRLPDIIFSSFQKQYFNLCIRSDLASIESCRDYFRIVDYQTVTRVQIFNDITENTMLRLAAFSVQYQQFGRGTVFQRILCD